jgi:hypothetical protein
MKTAVEWLEDNIERDMDYLEILFLIKHAKEMEKEQIIEFTNDYILTQCGASFEGNVEAGMLIEEYYKLTFKSE